MQNGPEIRKPSPSTQHVPRNRERSYVSLKISHSGSLLWESTLDVLDRYGVGNGSNEADIPQQSTRNTPCLLVAVNLYLVVQFPALARSTEHRRARCTRGRLDGHVVVLTDGPAAKSELHPEARPLPRRKIRFALGGRDDRPRGSPIGISVQALTPYGIESKPPSRPSGSAAAALLGLHPQIGTGDITGAIPIRRVTVGSPPGCGRDRGMKTFAGFAHARHPVLGRFSRSSDRSRRGGRTPPHD